MATVRPVDPSPPPGRGARRVVVDVKPESRRRVINQLRAKAASTTFPAEAAEFRRRANDLEEKYFPRPPERPNTDRFRVVTERARATEAARRRADDNGSVQDEYRRRKEHVDQMIREMEETAAKVRAQAQATARAAAHIRIMGFATTPSPQDWEAAGIIVNGHMMGTETVTTEVNGQTIITVRLKR